MELRQLRYFLTICEEGQITAAAKKLQMAQPPLSAQLKALEKELGVTLMLRGHRKITLSAAGEVFKLHAETILQQCENTKRKVLAMNSSMRSLLQIGIVSSAHVAFLNRGMQPFHHEHPYTDFNIKEGNTYQILSMLDGGIIEIGVVRTPFPMHQYDCIPLLEEEIILVVHKDIDPFTSDSISMQELHKQPILYYERFATMLNQLFEEAAIHPHIVCQNQDARTTLLWVNAKLGLGIVPRSAIHSIANTNLKIKTFENIKLPTAIMLVTKKNAYVSEAAQQFIQIYRNFK